ncbi:glycosyltransferase family 2 protein [soil metagenome]
MNSAPSISVIIPVKNESAGIKQLLNFLAEALPLDKEIIFLDGRSTDDTKAIIDTFSRTHPNFRVIDNLEGFVPFALNVGIKESHAEYIVRLDAHTEYSSDYFLRIMETFHKTGAEIVGGPMRAVGTTNLQKAIAYCTSTPFGVGDSSFHNELAEGFVDSVYLGAWKKSIFPIVGDFDVEMLRNQDDEFHYRAKSKGIKIYLNPEIKSWYYPRSDFNSLFKQYFQYGLFKPLVLKKVKSAVRIRHLIPAGFVLYLTLIPILTKFVGWFSVLPLLMYLLINLKFSFGNEMNLRSKVNSILIFPTLHFAYGIGFILGLFGLQPYFLKR